MDALAVAYAQVFAAYHEALGIAPPVDPDLDPKEYDSYLEAENAGYTLGLQRAVDILGLQLALEGVDPTLCEDSCGLHIDHKGECRPR